MSLRISPKWLQEYCQIDGSAEKIADHLSTSGFEAEVIDDIVIDPKLVVGEILSCKKHPEADKLNVCQVSVGSETLQIVCGCKTVVNAKYVIVAPVGSAIPGMTLKPVKLRGMDSQGMICSLKEIGLVDVSNGIYHIQESVTVGMPIVELIKHENKILEIDVTPNRGDCLSVYGIARDLAASQNKTLLPYPEGLDLSKIDTTDALFEVRSKNVVAYDALTAEINPESQVPLYMVNRMRQAGMGINHVVVDVLNYVMLEIGQPMHGFDQETLVLPLVMKEGDDQSFKLLDDSEYQPKEWDVLVCDQEIPQALAGIMGGHTSRMQEKTVKLQLESAVFSPKAIAKSLRRCQINSDASYRYERGVSSDLNQVALAYTARLLAQHVDANFSLYQSYCQDIAPTSVAFDAKFINQYLGAEIPEEEMRSMLQRLGFKGDNQQLVVPAYRYDVALPVDLAEEVARLYGYNNIALEPIYGALVPRLVKTDLSSSMKSALVNYGYHEAVQFSFISAEMLSLFKGEGMVVELSNPIHSDYPYMRTHLWQSLILAAKNNHKRQLASVKLFEQGDVFYTKEDTVVERPQIAAIATGTKDIGYHHEERDVDFYDMQSLALSLLNQYGIEGVYLKPSDYSSLHPKQSADIFFKGECVGTVGMLHPEVEIQIGLPTAGLMVLYLDKIQTKSPSVAKVPSKYPSVTRDITITVGVDDSAGEVQSALIDADIPYLKAVLLKDIYHQDDKVSITWSLLFQSDSETLSDKLIEKSLGEARKVIGA